MSVLYPRAVVRLAFLLDPGMTSGERDALARAENLARQYLGVSKITSHLMDWNTAQMVTVTPLRVSLRRNPYQEADACDIDLPYSVFPFDPRLARAVAVEVHLGQAVDATSAMEIGDATRRFVGWADDSDWEPLADNAIRLKCRDNTALLIDEPWDGSTVDVTRPLDVVVRGILDRRTSTSTMEVRWLTGRAIPTYSTLKSGDTTGTAFAASPKDTVWDVIQRLVRGCGLLCFVDDGRLVIAPGQTVEESERATGFVWGVNLKRLKLKKALRRHRPTPVIVKSWNPTLRATLTAIWPNVVDPELAQEAAADEATLSEKVGGGFQSRGSEEQLDAMARILDSKLRQKGLPRPRVDGGKQMPPTSAPPKAPRKPTLPGGTERRYYEVILSNDIDQATLETTARDIYNRMASSDLEVELETAEMMGPGGNDLLSLRAGDAVRVLVSESERDYLQARTVDERRRYLIERGYGEQVADSIARGYETLNNLFQVREARMQWDCRTGFSLEIEGIEYIQVEATL